MTEHVDVAVIAMGPGDRSRPAGCRPPDDGSWSSRELIGGGCDQWACVPATTLVCSGGSPQPGCPGTRTPTAVRADEGGRDVGDDVAVLEQSGGPAAGAGSEELVQRTRMGVTIDLPPLRCRA